jgi:hypothetical protein
MGTTADNALGSLNLANLTASGTILTRNGTSPTSIQITNTYTSATSFGLLDIRANAAQTAYEISSFFGSAGGAALPINIGHRIADGTFTSALSVATGTQSTLLTKDSHYITQTRQSSSGRMGFRIVVASSDAVFLRYNGAGNAEIGSASEVVEIWANNAARITVSKTGVATFSGQIIQVPPASVTLATNGQFSIEMTSDAAGNLVYRGSDGTTRRAALVFV